MRGVTDKLLLAVVTLASAAFGQSPKATPHHNALPPSSRTDQAEPEVSAQEIPVYKLEFKKADPLSGVTSSPVVVLPTQCTADGTLFLNMLKPPDFSKHMFFGIRGSKGQEYSASAIPSLNDLSVIDFFPSTSSVAFLVFATKEYEKRQDTHAGPDGKPITEEVNAGKHHYHIVNLDIDGSFKNSVELSIPYTLFHLAVLPSGEFIVSGYDQANNTPRMMLLNSKGETVGPVGLPMSIQSYDPMKNRNSTEAMVNASTTFSSTHFTSAGASVLAWHSGSADSVIEIGAGGRTREVPIAYPKGYVLAEFVPSNDRWLMRLQPENVVTTAAHDAKYYLYFDVLPNDGSLLRKLTEPGAVPHSIACEHDGTYISSEIDDKNMLGLLVAK